MSDRIFQGLVLQMRDASRRVVGVADRRGSVVACSDPLRIGLSVDLEAVGWDGESRPVVRSGGYTFKPLTSRSVSFDYAVFVEGEDEYAGNVCLMAAVTLDSVKAMYDDKHDRATFVKNILLGNILPGDVLLRARDLRFESECCRAVFLIRQLQGSELAVVDLLSGLYPNRYDDFVVSIDERDVVLVKQVQADADEGALRQLAQTVEEAISAELQIRTVVGVSSVVRHVKDLAAAFKEAQVAVEVGKVFDMDTSVIAYESLGIGRLIYQLPVTMCELFLSEIFKKDSIGSLDAEILRTIQSFFENSLNVSETARKLFIHRNTLVYRLEKIKRLTGLDLGRFEHAVVFKVAIMVEKYLRSQGRPA